MCKLTDNDYRNCTDPPPGEGNCKYVAINEYGVEYCTIDRIIQVKFYGCVPAKIKKGEEKNV